MTPLEAERMLKAQGLSVSEVAAQLVKWASKDPAAFAPLNLPPLPKPK